MSVKTIKIGNAGGYWGDDPSALERQVNGGRLDYITMDFLAEITMSIMQKQQSRDPEAGYAKDFIGMLKPILKKIVADKTTIITNAGGINPKSCANAIMNLGKELGVEPKISIVYGDDIIGDIDEVMKKGASFQNMETGEEFNSVKDKIEAANIYFGAAPVVEALKDNPDIIITGRVTDTGITMAAMVHEFGWSLDDWDKLAHGIVAGHIMECGTQATGGNFTDWEKVESFDNVGFPIVEVSETGEFTVTKHEGTGGLVSVDTVREQLFYEMGHPGAYITPDVIADFTTIHLEQQSPGRVRVSGVKGYAPTPLYKVSMAYEDGFKAQGSIIISGPNARAKAETFAKIFWNRCGTDYLETSTEYVGWNACQRSLVKRDDGNEILLRLGVRAEDEKTIRKFAKLIPSLILSGPPGVAVLGGVPRPQKVVSYWPALLSKDICHPYIAKFENGQLVDEKMVTNTATGNFVPDDQATTVAVKANASIEDVIAEQKPNWVLLSELCLGRSGDKGDMCNIGVMARDQASYDYLKTYLTAQRVKNFFQELCQGTVTRYELPNMLGFNFLLDSALGGGGTKTLRLDAQGKTFAQALLAQRVPKP
ncbi:MAG: DUF1446 domain-containing protein [Pseudobacteriovorax sp.]|nr:DUF1446 domain-containing protein [Pseudobacteriovorax sp.]